MEQIADQNFFNVDQKSRLKIKRHRKDPLPGDVEIRQRRDYRQRANSLKSTRFIRKNRRPRPQYNLK